MKTMTQNILMTVLGSSLMLGAELAHAGFELLPENVARMEGYVSTGGSLSIGYDTRLLGSYSDGNAVYYVLQEDYWEDFSPANFFRQTKAIAIYRREGDQVRQLRKTPHMNLSGHLQLIEGASNQDRVVLVYSGGGLSPIVMIHDMNLPATQGLRQIWTVSGSSSSISIHALDSEHLVAFSGTAAVTVQAFDIESESVISSAVLTPGFNSGMTINQIRHLPAKLEAGRYHVAIRQNLGTQNALTTLTRVDIQLVGSAIAINTQPEGSAIAPIQSEIALVKTSQAGAAAEGLFLGLNQLRTVNLQSGQTQIRTGVSSLAQKSSGEILALGNGQILNLNTGIAVNNPTGANFYSDHEDKFLRLATPFRSGIYTNVGPTSVLEAFYPLSFMLGSFDRRAIVMAFEPVFSSPGYVADFGKHVALVSVDPQTGRL